MEKKERIPSSVRKCAAALKAADSDSEKFASLFLVTKIIQADECSNASLKHLFDAIGFEFLDRLLKSEDVPEDCPPFIYKSVALAIVSSFCTVPAIVNSQSVISIIPVLLDIISLADSEDNLMLVSDCYSCLSAIAGFQAGREALVAKHAGSVLVEVYMEEMFRHDEALNLLVYLASHQGSDIWLGSEDSFSSMMNRLTNDFVGDSTERKFELGKMLSVLLCNSAKVPVDSLISEDWPENLLKSLEGILCSKIGTSHRDTSLQLVSRLVEMFGVDWILRTPDRKPFLLLLVNLSCVEIRMKLEDQTFEQVLEHADIIVACYTIVELFIAFMTRQAFLDFDQKQREQAYCALKGGVGAILSLLNRVAEAGDWRLEKDPKPTSFLCASIRILGAWLAEETSTMKGQVNTLLPFIVDFCCRSFERSKAGDTAAPGTDALRFILPAFCHLTAEDEARKILLRENLHQLLYEYLVFQWDIFNQWLSQQPKLAEGWLHSETEEESNLAEKSRPDSEAAVNLVCGIYMNIIVLEAQLTATHSVFSQLLKFSFQNAPLLRNRQDFVVLHGNVAVLGLLILRHHTWKYPQGDSSIFRYIQSTVSFLWDAHNSEESCQELALVISLRYKRDWPDLAELWYLGMQSLSNVMAQLDWIVEFIVDSGWPQEIMRSLSKIISGSIDANTRTAYEDFLCCLVKAQPKIKSIINEFGGKRTCRSHSMKQLLALLGPA